MITVLYLQPRPCQTRTSNCFLDIMTCLLNRHLKVDMYPTKLLAIPRPKICSFHSLHRLSQCSRQKLLLSLILPNLLEDSGSSTFKIHPESNQFSCCHTTPSHRYFSPDDSNGLQMVSCSYCSSLQTCSPYSSQKDSVTTKVRAITFLLCLKSSNGSHLRVKVSHQSDYKMWSPPYLSGLLFCSLSSFQPH